MRNTESTKTNPSESSCEMLKPITDGDLRVLRESSTYTGAYDDDEHSPHWMDRHHDYGGSED